MLPKLPHQVRKLLASKSPKRDPLRVRKCPVPLGKPPVVDRLLARVFEGQETGPRKRRPPSLLDVRDLLLERTLRAGATGHEHKLGGVL
jgi:hypothetical protein